MHLDVPVVPALSKKKIEDRVAGIVREQYPDAWKGLEPIPVDDLYEFVAPSMLGISVDYRDLSSMGLKVEGWTNSDQKVSYVDSAIAQNFSVAGRRYYRSTVGHELGHCFLHMHLGRWRASRQFLGLSLHRDRRLLKPYEDPEWQAWHFCKELCAPQHLVQRLAAKYHKNTATMMDAMIETFDMSYSFIESRLRSLKLSPIKK